MEIHWDSLGSLDSLASLASWPSSRARDGTVGEKANESGKMIESSGNTGRVWRKFEAKEKRGSNPKTSKAVKKQQKTSNIKEAKW